MLIKNRLFWKFGWIHSMLFLLVLVAIYTYVVRSIRLEYIQDAFRELEAFSQLAKGRPPANREEITLKEWSNWMARAGIRITIIDPDGIVLADSEEDPVTMDNHRSRPEIREAQFGVIVARPRSPGPPRAQPYARPRFGVLSRPPADNGRSRHGHSFFDSAGES